MWSKGVRVERNEDVGTLKGANEEIALAELVFESY